MRQTLFLIGLVASLHSLSFTSAQAGELAVSVDKIDAGTWLKKIRAAAEHLDYSGVFVYQQGDQVRTSRITHVTNGHDETERLEVLDGASREYIRNNDDILYYMPDLKTLLMEKRVTHEVFPAILNAAPSDLADYYAIRKAGSGRIAGFECQSVILEPKDDFRYGYKLCAEKNSGLLLRAQTLNASGAIVEQISFTQVAIGKIDRSRVKVGVVNTRGWRIENAIMDETHLTGWSVKAPPPGFRKIHEIKRLVSDSTDKKTSASQRELSQIVYSDGLAAISIFIEPATQSRTEGSLQQGAMNIVGKRYGDFWLTIVGEVPSAAIRRVANSVEFKSK